MVKSILDNTIDYNEPRDIEADDIDFDANLYETKMFDKTIVFALGKPKYTFIDKNIVYYPIYLVEKDEIKMQIGLYEIPANTQEELLDADGDIDLNKFSKPIVYALTINELGLKPQPNKATGKAAASKKNNPWIKAFMKDDDFGIIDTPYDGNCFFNMIRLALEENEQEVSVDDMRELLAANANEDLLQQYKGLYDDFKMEEASLTREIKNITSRFNTLQTKLKGMKDRNLQLSFIKQSEDMKAIHDRLKGERTDLKDIMKEFEFMNGIDNLPMLRLKIKTRDYWADTWAISTLERELNIKIIVFSEANFREGDELNVLQCGQLNDTVLEERGIFEPSFYVLAAHHGGSHYQLITYKEQKSFDFSELPESVKTLVIEKCLEKIAGPYSLIPDWIKGEPPMAVPPQGELPQNAPSIQVTQPPSEVVAVEPLSSDLYSSGTVFRFYSKSADKPAPGKGEGESLGPEGSATYDDLKRIPSWRKKLSNFWPSEFKLDGHKWLSVEHYYQASKFKKNNKEFYIKFSLDAKDSPIAKDAALAKAAGGKSGKFKGELVRPKDVKIDSDFFSQVQGSKYTRAEQEMENAMRAKFTQNADLKALLIATKKAKLEHIKQGKPAVVFDNLMRVRRDF
jgi:predicted NAD-dependent protein-ADP-ribosyltransferase YbiA (DUF1768 family)